MRGLSIYEIKRICHRAQFFIILRTSLKPLTNFLNKLKNNLSPKHQAKLVVIFIQLLYSIFNYC